MASRATATRERILDAAEHLVLEHGFASTTVDAVLAEARTSKGAFFHHFPTKTALGQALVERYAAKDAGLLDSLLSAAEAESDDPVDQLIAFLAAFEQVVDEQVKAQPGCLFVSFIYEADLNGASTETIVADAILLWRTRLLGKLEDAAAERPSMPPVDLPSLADQVFSLFEGGYLLARALDEPDALRKQLAHLRHYVELLFDRPVRP